MISAWKWRHLNGFCSVMSDPLLLFSLNFSKSVYFLQHNPLARIVASRLIFRGRRTPPGGEDPPCYHEIRLLHIAVHLLAEVLVVIRHARPLAQERLYDSSADLQILKKALPFGGISAPFQFIGACLHILKTVLAQQVSQLT